MTGVTTHSKLPFLAFAADKGDMATLADFARAQGWAENCIHSGDIRTAVEYLKTHPSPVVLLVELPSAEEAPAMLDALADVCDPETKVVTIGDINEYSFYCWLMDLGIFSYLLKPLTTAMLQTAWEKSSQVAQQRSHEKTPGKVIAVMGARGGVGASTVALNLAGILAEQSGKSIALVDIDPQEGSISLMLDIEPSRGLRDALEKPDRIDSLFLERVMHKPIKYLSVLSAEEMLGDRVNVHPDAAETLLTALRNSYDIVLLDIPRFLNPFSRACLKQAEQVILVAELTLVSLRDTLRINDMMRETLKMKPPLMIANCVGLAPKQEMQAGDFEKGVGAKLVQRIPFAPELFMQAGSDIPAVKNKAQAASKPLYALAAQLVPAAKQKAPPSAKKPFRFFRK